MKSKYYWDPIYRGITAGDRVQLGRGLSLIESKKEADKVEAGRLIDACLQNTSGKSIRVGITGSPGSGKSSTIECIGMAAIERGYKVAVLAIDPSSSLTGGSILGDKTRMPQLSASKKAFIRPSAAGSTLGGVASATREAIALCEAAGYDLIIIETVGVGQSETAVYHMTDLFVFLVLPGAGDELQGIKRGIVEMADLVVINKADEERTPLAEQSKKDYSNALHLFREKESGWQVKVLTHSIFDPKKTEAILNEMEDFNRFVSEKSFKTSKRQEQQLNWFEELLKTSIIDAVLSSRKGVEAPFDPVKKEVAKGILSPRSAVLKVMERLKGELNL